MKDDELDMLLGSVEEQPEAAPPVSHELLGRYAAGQVLSDDDEAAVEAYLASSEAARDRLAALQQPPDPLHDWAVQALQTEAQRQRFRVRRTVAAAGGLLAAAAAVLLVVDLPDSGPAFPTYGMEGPGGAVRAERNEEAQAQIFIPDSVLELVVRPEEPTDAQHRFALYVHAAGRWVRKDDVGQVTVGGTGTFLFEAAARDLFSDDFGERRIAAVVSRKDPLPPELPSGTDRQALGPHAWFERTVTYGPAPPPVP